MIKDSKALGEKIKPLNPNHRLSFGKIDFDKFTIEDLKDRRDYFFNSLLEPVFHYSDYLELLANEYKMVDEYLKLKMSE